MYLSHPVRQMCDDPGDGEVALVVELEGTEAEDALCDVVDDADGAVEEDLGFDCFQVRVPERAIAALCEIDDVVRIETTATLELGVDDDSTKGGSTDP